MNQDDFIKQAEDGVITNKNGKFVVGLDYLFSKYDISEKEEPVYDCFVNPMTGRSQSARSMERLQKQADDHGYILVPRFASRDVLNRLLRDVLQHIEVMEYRGGQFQERKSEHVFDVPNYEKECGFSPAFRTAFRNFYMLGVRMASGLFSCTWVLPEDQRNNCANSSLIISRHIIEKFTCCKNDIIVTVKDGLWGGSRKSFSLKEVDKIEITVESSIETLLGSTCNATA